MRNAAHWRRIKMHTPTVTHCRQDTKMRPVISLPDCAKIVWYAYFKKRNSLVIRGTILHELSVLALQINILYMSVCVSVCLCALYLSARYLKNGFMDHHQIWWVGAGVEPLEQFQFWC